MGQTDVSRREDFHTFRGITPVPSTGCDESGDGVKISKKCFVQYNRFFVARSYVRIVSYAVIISSVVVVVLVVMVVTCILYSFH